MLFLSRHVDRATLAVLVIVDEVVFHPSEVRQDIVPAPSIESPVVVVSLAAPDPSHGVHRAASAEHLAAGLVDPAMGATRLRFGEVVPVDLRVELARKRSWCTHLKAPIRTASFDKQDRDGRILSQSCRYR